MGHAARAIVIEDNKILVMYRKKGSAVYYTLVGGRLNDGETADQAVIREVKEETGLDISSAKLIYTELHPEPYNNQSIFLCTVAPHGEIAVQPTSEEALMNRIEINIHQPMWIELNQFSKLPFSTMRLQQAIVQALQTGFPEQPVQLS